MKNISANLVKALEYAGEIGAKVVGVVGRDGGHTARVADACVIIPTVNPETITPHAEAFQAVDLALISVASDSQSKSDKVGIDPVKLQGCVSRPGRSAQSSHYAERKP